ncbi:unnamed protein product [Closterium sp. NIES-64]|nr:unnamed protein product [Closterium sp. NIES-64]
MLPSLWQAEDREAQRQMVRAAVERWRKEQRARDKREMNESMPNTQPPKGERFLLGPKITDWDELRTVYVHKHPASKSTVFSFRLSPSNSPFLSPLPSFSPPVRCPNLPFPPLPFPRRLGRAARGLHAEAPGEQRDANWLDHWDEQRADYLTRQGKARVMLVTPVWGRFVDSTKRSSLSALTLHFPSGPLPFPPLPPFPFRADWDEQRADYVRKHPGCNETRQGKARVMLVTGSQPGVCDNDVGDFLLLKSLKNKLDYCSPRDIQIYYSTAILDRSMDSFWIYYSTAILDRSMDSFWIYYSTAILDRSMDSFWVKLPLLRKLMLSHAEVEWFWWMDSDAVFTEGKKLMLSHAEVEWFWWMDSDAVFTDMTFDVPFEKYEPHVHMVMHGYDSLVYGKKDWVGLDAGIYLIRNSQWSLGFMEDLAQFGVKWSLDFMEDLAQFGVKGPMRDAAGVKLFKELSGAIRDAAGVKLFKELSGDDQSAIVWMMACHPEKYAKGIYLENTGTRPMFEGDDQSAIVWMMAYHPEKYAKGIHLESSFMLHSFWPTITPHYEELMDKHHPGYEELMDKHHPGNEELMDKHHPGYEELMDKYHPGYGDHRWPLITHFVGCKPCGKIGQIEYEETQRCVENMERAFNFADNQVLRKFGYEHLHLDTFQVVKINFTTYKASEFDSHPLKNRQLDF